MGPAILRREVLPPRQAPTSSRDLSSEERVRAAIKRSIWTTVAIAGLGSLVNAATRLLEAW